MRLTIARNDDPEGCAPYSIDLAPPGATIGRWPGNSLVLPDPSGRLCKIQAALRIRESACNLRNLSSMSRVCINGAALGCEQDAVVKPGDEILIGDYKLQLMPPGASPFVQSQAQDAKGSLAAGGTQAAADSPAVASAAVPAGSGAAGGSQPAPDVFADLMGPGTLPVGAPPDMSAPHPFEMASAAPRNHPDPLTMLAPAERQPGQAHDGDPLALFGEAGGDRTPHLLSDPTPTTLPRGTALRELVGGNDGDAPPPPRHRVHEGS